MAKGKRLRVALGTCQGCGLLWTLRKEKGKHPVIASHAQPEDSHLVGDACPGGGAPPFERGCDVAGEVGSALIVYAAEQSRLSAAHARGEGVHHYRIEHRKGERIRLVVEAADLEPDIREAQCNAARLHALTAATDARRHAQRLSHLAGKVAGKRMTERALPGVGDKVKMELPDITFDGGSIGVVKAVEPAGEGEWDITVYWSNARTSVIRFPRYLLTLVSR